MLFLLFPFWSSSICGTINSAETFVHFTEHNHFMYSYAGGDLPYSFTISLLETST